MQILAHDVATTMPFIWPAVDMYSRAMYESVQTPVFELPPQFPQDQGKLTVVLDIDETLIHTDVIGYSESAPEDGLDLTEAFFINLYGVTLRVRKRPFLKEFLVEAASKFELIAFTAGAEDYATHILDHIDPDRTIFRHRLYRQHCIPRLGNNFIKDLRIVNRQLSRTVLVDNNAHSFLHQLGNGIPIASFFHDHTDQALIVLYHFLDSLMHETDVRPTLERVFKLEATYGELVRCHLQGSNVHFK